MRPTHVQLIVRMMFLVLFVVSVNLAQAQGKAASVDAKQIARIVDLLPLTKNVDLSSVEKLLTNMRLTLSQSQTARERLYYKINQPRDDYVRFKHLERLGVALTLHASLAAESRDFARVYRALDLAIQTMQLIATAPAPPAKLRLGERVVLPGELSAGEPVWALRSILFNFNVELKKIMDTQPETVGAALVPVSAKSVALAFTIVSEPSRQRKLKQLIDQRKDKEFARECWQIRQEVAKGLSDLRKDLALAFKKLKS